MTEQNLLESMLWTLRFIGAVLSFLTIIIFIRIFSTGIVNWYTSPDGSFHKLCERFFNAGDLDLLEKWCLKRLKKFPNSFSANYWLGRLYYETDKKELYLVSFKRALELKPDWSEAINPYLENAEYTDGY